MFTWLLGYVLMYGVRLCLTVQRKKASKEKNERNINIKSVEEVTDVEECVTEKHH